MTALLDTPAALDDSELMTAVRDGSVEALGLLYTRFRMRVYRIAQSICRDDGRAQEAVQETFISIWTTRASYEQQRGAVAAWVLTIARHRAIDIARRDQRHTAHRTGDEHLATLSATGDVAEDVVRLDQTRTLHDQLARLPETQREVITLAFYGQLSHTEIAEHLRLPTGTVKGRMRLGLRRLRHDVQRAAS